MSDLPAAGEVPRPERGVRQLAGRAGRAATWLVVTFAVVTTLGNVLVATFLGGSTCDDACWAQAGGGVPDGVSWRKAADAVQWDAMLWTAWASLLLLGVAAGAGLLRLALVGPRRPPRWLPAVLLLIALAVSFVPFAIYEGRADLGFWAVVS